MRRYKFTVRFTGSPSPHTFYVDSTNADDAWLKLITGVNRGNSVLMSAKFERISASTVTEGQPIKWHGDPEPGHYLI